MKKMKKAGILFVLFALLMLNPVLCSADSTAQEIADSINLDMMTVQSGYAVTKDLDFSGVIAEVKSSGGAVVFTSSDTATLCVSGSKGIIVRDDDEDKTLTLNATVSKGADTAQKEMTLTVPSKSTYVFESEGFARADCIGKGIKSVGDRWVKSTLTETSVNGVLGKIEKSADGYAFSIIKDSYSTLTTPVVKYDFTDIPKTDVLTFSYSITLGKYSIDSTTANQDGVYCDMDLYALDENGSALTTTGGLASYIARARFEVYKEDAAENARLRFTTRKSDVSGNNSFNYTTGSVPIGTKVRVTHEVDFKTQTYTLYVNGTAVESLKFLEDSDSAAAFLNYFQLAVQRQGLSAEMQFDDFVVTSRKALIYGTDLTVNDGGKLALNVTGKNERISITSQYSKEETLTQVLGVNSSSNEHIDFYDAYLKDAGDNVTYLWEQGGGRTGYISDEAAPIMFGGVFVGANHGPAAPRITVANHGKTVADVGTLWRDAAGGEWVLVEVKNTNQLILFTTNVPAENRGYNFDYLVAQEDADGNASCVLTRIEDGEETEDTMTFTAQLKDQLFRLTKDNTQVCTVLLPDGTEEVIDLSVDRELTADRVQIVDSYTITDARTFAASLIANRPEGGYSEENPPNYASGADIIYYKTTYTITGDGAILTEYDHKYNAATNGCWYYAIQYYMKANLGGGVKRLIPGTTAFTGNSSVFTGRDSCTAGEEQTFDFSTPWQLYRFDTGLDYNTFNLPADSTSARLTKGHGYETDTVPSRVIDFMYDGNDVSDIAFASGFLPLYDAEPEERQKYTDYAFSSRGTAKAYHYLISKNKCNAGDTIKGIGYRKYEDADSYGGNASVYTVPYGNEVYYYVDLLKDSEVDIYAHGACEDALTLVENYGDAQIAVSDGKITVSGDAKDYIVFTLPAAGLSIEKISCNVATGKVSALINNLSSQAESVTLLCAGYRNGKMTQLELKETSVAGGNSVVIFDGDYSSAEEYSVFMLDENGALKPLCDKVSRDGFDF